MPSRPAWHYLLKRQNPIVFPLLRVKDQLIKSVGPQEPLSLSAAPLTYLLVWSLARTTLDYLRLSRSLKASRPALFFNTVLAFLYKLQSWMINIDKITTGISIWDSIEFISQVQKSWQHWLSLSMNVYLHHTDLTHTSSDFRVLVETTTPLCWLVFCQGIRVIQWRGTSGEETLPTERPVGMSVGPFPDWWLTLENLTL